MNKYIIFLLSLYSVTAVANPFTENPLLYTTEKVSSLVKNNSVSRKVGSEIDQYVRNHKLASIGVGIGITSLLLNAALIYDHFQNRDSHIVKYELDLLEKLLNKKNPDFNRLISAFDANHFLHLNDMTKFWLYRIKLASLIKDESQFAEIVEYLEFEILVQRIQNLSLMPILAGLGGLAMIVKIAKY